MRRWVGISNAQINKHHEQRSPAFKQFQSLDACKQIITNVNLVHSFIYNCVTLFILGTLWHTFHFGHIGAHFSFWAHLGTLFILGTFGHNFHFGHIWAHFSFWAHWGTLFNVQLSIVFIFFVHHSVWGSRRLKVTNPLFYCFQIPPKK